MKERHRQQVFWSNYFLSECWRWKNISELRFTSNGKFQIFQKKIIIRFFWKPSSQKLKKFQIQIPWVGLIEIQDRIWEHFLFYCSPAPRTPLNNHVGGVAYTFYATLRVAQELMGGKVVSLDLVCNCFFLHKKRSFVLLKNTCMY